MTLFAAVLADYCVELKWIKGHSQSVGNDYADMLARKGMELATELIYQSPFRPVTQTQVKKSLRRDFYNKWQRRWDNDHTCRVSHLFRPQVGERKNISLMSFYELSRLSQILTGHGLFKRHLRHWNDIEDIQCALCGEDDEYSWHLWEYCPIMDDERGKARYLISHGFSSEKTMLRFFSTTPMRELMAQNEALIGGIS